MIEQQWQQGLHSGHAARRVWIWLGLFLKRMRRVVGTDDVRHTLIKPAPQAVPMRGGADGWVHLRMTAQAGISVFGRKRQVLGRNLACGDILVLSDQFQFSGRGYMQYVEDRKSTRLNSSH